jgi:hypothetical protein
MIPISTDVTTRRHPATRWLRETLRVGVITLAAQVSPLQAQPDLSPPDTVAAEYFRGFQSMAWDGLAQRIHPEALAYLRLAIDIQIDADTTGWSLANLGNSASRDDYDQRPDALVFADAMRWVQANAPGLLSSMVSRSVEAIGVVMEGSDAAHAVYRVTTLAYGAEPVAQVASLLRTDAGWKVREASEIRVLHTALRRIPIPVGQVETKRPRRSPGRLPDA